jgi:plasmid rolling circle replication initiator protein Rep
MFPMAKHIPVLFSQFEKKNSRLNQNKHSNEKQQHHHCIFCSLSQELLTILNTDGNDKKKQQITVTLLIPQ